MEKKSATFNLDLNRFIEETVTDDLFDEDDEDDFCNKVCNFLDYFAHYS